MVPFSPDRLSATDAPAPLMASPENAVGGTTVSSGSRRGSATGDATELTAVVSKEVDTTAVVGVNVEEAATGTFAHADALSTPATASIRAGGVGELNSTVSVKSFGFSDDEDDHDDDFITKRGIGAKLSSKHVTAVRQDDGFKGKDDGTAGEGEGGHIDTVSVVDDTAKNALDGGEQMSSRRSRATNDEGAVENAKGNNSGRGELSELHPRKKSLPDRLGSAKRPEDDGGQDESDPLHPPRGRGIDVTCPTPASAAWAPPDFGFSSDDELDVDLSDSNESSSRIAETKGDDEHTTASSLSPMQESSGGFDSNSGAS